MRIKRLQISSFKNLRDFSIDFDTDTFTSIIVGQNGTGKSNILEALIIIFRDLDLDVAPTFKYELEYQCHGHQIYVDADPSRSTRKLRVQVNGEDISKRQFLQLEREQYLPKYVFGYYSGPSNRMEMHFERHQERFSQDLLSGKDRPLRPLLYARHVHSQFVLLAFFNDPDEKISKFLSDHLRIEALDSVLFVMKKPSWRSKTGDPRFWNARGVVQEFLSNLYQLSLAPMRIEPLDQLYLYLKDTETLRRLADNYTSPQAFFKALESTYISDLIQEVRIRVIVRNADGSLTFQELSEGEQQLLMVLGLLRFTKEDESLFFLDEPDTHLNPAWSMQYLEFLKQIVGNQKTSHILMTSHDPLVIAGLERNQIRILRIDEETGLIEVDRPDRDPIKMGYPEILTSEIFGLRSIINPSTLALLDEKRQLAVKDTLTEEERNRLDDLNQQLEGFDLTKAVKDPLYEPFVREMTKAEDQEDIQAPVLTKEQQERRDKLAAEILRKLKAEQEQES